jgi:ParB family chromosome partitioning protein
MENIVRDDLNAVDRAAALRTLKQQLNDAPWDDVAEMVGIRRSRLFQLLGTEKLPASVQEDIRSGRLSEKQSRALQGLPPVQQEALRDAMLERELSAEQALGVARTLKQADLPHDAAETAQFIAAACNDMKPAPAPADPLSQIAELLAAIESAAAGERGAPQMLASAASSAKSRPFAGDRLRGEVLVLARTLARTPSSELVPGGAAYMPLTMLRAALNALLPEE